MVCVRDFSAHWGRKLMEFPYQTAKEILVKAAITAGHSAEIADALAQSAWWLENRGLNGVAQVIAYLDATREARPADLGAKRDEYGSVRCVCPITAAAVIMAEREAHREADAAEDIPVEYGLFGGPASPLIMGAMLAFYAGEQDMIVRLRFGENLVVLAKDFCCIEAGSVAGFADLDAMAADPTEAEFLAQDGFVPVGQVTAYQKKLTLDLPAERLTDDQSLTFM